MKRQALSFVSALVALAVTSPAMAGFLTWDGSVPTGGDIAYSNSSWTQTYTGSDITQLDWAIDTARTGNSTVGYLLSGTINTDPTIRLIQDLDNLTASAWTGYHIQIFPDAFSTVSNIIVLSVTASGGSTAPTTTVINGPTNEITLTGGNVLPGDTLTVDFKFDINTTDSSGHFFYTIDNTPITDGGDPNIPEPASLAVLGLGAAGLLLRRRK